MIETRTQRGNSLGKSQLTSRTPARERELMKMVLALIVLKTQFKFAMNSLRLKIHH